MFAFIGAFFYKTSFVVSLFCYPPNALYWIDKKVPGSWFFFLERTNVFSLTYVHSRRRAKQFGGGKNLLECSKQNISKCTVCSPKKDLQNFTLLTHRISVISRVVWSLKKRSSFSICPNSFKFARMYSRFSWITFKRGWWFPTAPFSNAYAYV